MPWRQSAPMDERLKFIGDYARGELEVAELCRRYSISRKTGYKWIARYELDGGAGLLDRSRRPRSCPHRTATEVEEALVELRQLHPTWGAKKLLKVLGQRQPRWALPARSTCCDLLLRHGLVPYKRRRRPLIHPGRPLTGMDAPNAIWTADFKGQFRTGDGEYCYPLTVVDGYSRFLLGCQGLRSTRIELAKPVFQRLFAEYGLPQMIRTDNGVPFASTALGRLSTLSVWWIRLGIRPELIQPAHPEQNGRHERMHRTLKAETTRPPRDNLSAQQVRFNRFRREYNEVRPHEALDQEVPASLYCPSPRPLPRKVPPIDYPAQFEVRLVSNNGGIRWNCEWVNVTHTLGGEYVGLEEVGDGLWDVFFGPLKLGRLDERRRRIEDHKGRWIRRQVLPMSPD